MTNMDSETYISESMDFEGHNSMVEAETSMVSFAALEILAFNHGAGLVEPRTCLPVSLPYVQHIAYDESLMFRAARHKESAALVVRNRELKHSCCQASIAHAASSLAEIW